MGAGRKTGNERFRSAREAGWVYATRNRIVRRVFDKGNNDVFWMDFWNGNARDQRPTAVSAQLFRFTESESFS